MFRQATQYGQGFRRELHFLFASLQLSPRGVEPIETKAKYLLCLHFRRSTSLREISELSDDFCPPCSYPPGTKRARLQAKRVRLKGVPVSQDAEEQAPLSVHWAFLVHFRINSEVARGRLAGRVEHVVSGQSAHFASLEELLAFIARVLATVRAPPRRSRGKGNAGR